MKFKLILSAFAILFLSFMAIDIFTGQVFALGGAGPSQTALTYSLDNSYITITTVTLCGPSYIFTTAPVLERIENMTGCVTATVSFTNCQKGTPEQLYSHILVRNLVPYDHPMVACHLNLPIQPEQLTTVNYNTFCGYIPAFRSWTSARAAPNLDYMYQIFSTFNCEYENTPGTRSELTPFFTANERKTEENDIVYPLKILLS